MSSGPTQRHQARTALWTNGPSRQSGCGWLGWGLLVLKNGDVSDGDGGSTEEASRRCPLMPTASLELPLSQGIQG